MNIVTYKTVCKYR